MVTWNGIFIWKGTYSIVFNASATSKPRGSNYRKEVHIKLIWTSLRSLKRESFHVSPSIENFGVCSLKLGEKAEIVLGKETNVIDVVTEQRKTLDTHAPGVAGVDFRIDAAVFQNFRMDHAGAGNF